MPFSKYWQNFPHRVTKSGNPKIEPFNQHHKPGYLTMALPTLPSSVQSWVQHKTEPKSYLTHFYVFKVLSSLQIPLSCAVSDRLLILEFKVPNETPSTLIDAIMTLDSKTLVKKVTFQTPLETTWPKIPSQPSGTVKLKPTLKNPIPRNTTPDSTKLTPPGSSQWHPSPEMNFPLSFDTIGDMPSTYTIHNNPSIPSVHHTEWKVLIECCNQIRKTLDKMVTPRITAPVTWLTKWVSSLTYLLKLDGILCIYLNPRDLNKKVMQEHYRAPTLDEISHHLSRATTFSMLDAKYGFWSIHLDEKSSYLATFNTHKGGARSYACLSTWGCSRVFFQMCLDQVTGHLPGIIAIHDGICI